MNKRLVRIALCQIMKIDRALSEGKAEGGIRLAWQSVANF
jgi:hypothetical protein